MRPIKFASYLDEAAEEPEQACIVLKNHNINYVALRHIWSSNISNLTDQSCNLLRQTLNKHDITAVMLSSTLGEVKAAELNKIPEAQINRLFDLAAYFGVSLLKIGVGHEGRSIDDTVISEWMDKISTKAIVSNIQPLIEITHTCTLAKPAYAVEKLSAHKRWRILYDPAQLVMKQVQDPFIKYWTILKKYVTCIDIHDYKTGYGHKPIGFGNSKIIETIKDAENDKYSGWYIFEPSLGRKHGNALTKQDVFSAALKQFNNCMESHLGDNK